MVATIAVTNSVSAVAATSSRADTVRIYFASDRTGDWDLYTVKVDGTDLTDLTNTRSVNETFPRVSPDGTRLAYTVGTPPTSSIVVSPVDDLTQQTPVVAGDQAAWSPDGTRFAFSAVPPGDTRTQIYVVNVTVRAPTG